MWIKKLLPRPSANTVAGWRTLPLLLLVLAGCSAETSLSGTVTYNGAPLASGCITFFPAGDTGPTQGAEILQGKYRVAGFVPGKKRVLIAEKLHVQLVQADHGKSHVRVVRGADAIPADAAGNNQILEVAAGEHDFHLKGPGR
jgi:hypothetical protein